MSERKRLRIHQGIGRPRGPCYIYLPESVRGCTEAEVLKVQTHTWDPHNGGLVTKPGDIIVRPIQPDADSETAGPDVAQEPDQTEFEFGDRVVFQMADGTETTGTVVDIPVVGVVLDDEEGTELAHFPRFLRRVEAQDADKTEARWDDDDAPVIASGTLAEDQTESERIWDNVAEVSKKRPSNEPRWTEEEIRAAWVAAHDRATNEMGEGWQPGFRAMLDELKPAPKVRRFVVELEDDGERWIPEEDQRCIFGPSDISYRGARVVREITDEEEVGDA